MGCPRCGVPLSQVGCSARLCGQCQKRLPEFEKTEAVLVYQRPAPYLIQALKFNARYPCARLLGTLLAEKVCALSDRPQQILPVPLHPKRYRQRGFNQAIEIARPVSRILNIPLNLSSCQRTRNTTPQTQLSGAQRNRNMKDAFSIRTAPAAEHIAILDDVVTTGATVNELAKVLRSSGVKRVDVWACARA